LHDATECKPLLDVRPAARRLVAFVLGHDAQEEAIAIEADVTQLAMNAVIALPAFASVKIAPQGDG
jgi:hypothetical protein